MDEEIERLVVSVRADTGVFAKDVATMREGLEGPFASGVERAGRSVETALLRAVRTGKLGFDDLGKVAMGVMGDIAAAAVRSGIDSIAGGARGGGGGAGGGLLSAIVGLIGGVAGRATGGPVSPGTAYMVGERGPELFVPTASGRIAASAAAPAIPARPILAAPAAARDVRVAITVKASGGDAPAALSRSSRQVARAVRSALMEEA